MQIHVNKNINAIFFTGELFDIYWRFQCQGKHWFMCEGSFSRFPDDLLHLVWP